MVQTEKELRNKSVDELIRQVIFLQKLKDKYALENESLKTELMTTQAELKAVQDLNYRIQSTLLDGYVEHMKEVEKLEKSLNKEG